MGGKGGTTLLRQMHPTLEALFFCEGTATVKVLRPQEKCCEDGGNGVCAAKAERICWLVLPGERTWSPFEEAILHSWIGGLVAHPVG